ncbi:MAG: DUF2683 family protein [Candidatus Diapherotrites archaeon]
MTQTVVTLSERQDRVVSIIKGKFGLKNKSNAINLIIEQFEEKLLEPELRPEYKKELQKIDSGKFKKFASIEALRREIENVHA